MDLVGGNGRKLGEQEEEICPLPIYPIPFSRSLRPRFRYFIPLFGPLIPSFAEGGGDLISGGNLSELVHGRRKPCNSSYPIDTHTI